MMMKYYNYPTSTTSTTASLLFAVAASLLLFASPSGPPLFARASEEQPLIGVPQDVLQSLLPPQPDWDGSKSVAEFVVEDKDDPFVTPAEASDFTETARYSEVKDFITKMASEFSDKIRVKTIATLPTGHDMVRTKNRNKKN